MVDRPDNYSDADVARATALVMSSLRSIAMDPHKYRADLPPFVRPEEELFAQAIDALDCLPFLESCGTRLSPHLAELRALFGAVREAGESDKTLIQRGAFETHATWREMRDLALGLLTRINEA